MNDTPTPLTTDPVTDPTSEPQAPATLTPLLGMLWGWVKPALIHGSFHVIRAALIWVGSWTAMHHISFIAASVTPDRVNDIATKIMAYSVPLLAALDHAVRANPQIWNRCPGWCRSVWNFFHVTDTDAVAMKTAADMAAIKEATMAIKGAMKTLPVVSEIRSQPNGETK